MRRKITRENCRGTWVPIMSEWDAQDRFDEDMFARLPRRAWTVRVGSGATSARFRVRGPASVVGLLRLLLDRLSLPTTPG